MASAPQDERGQDESGVLLVLWALSLGALLGCLALALNLGDLQQKATNAQDAADAAALTAAGELGPALPLSTYPSVPSCWPDIHGDQHCPCPVDLAKGCRNYKWLDNYYIYVDSRGWLQVGQQISGSSAFQDGLSDGWYCSSWAGPPKEGHCTQVSTSVAGSAPGALTDSTTAGELASAAQAAQSLATSYFAGGQSTSDWTSCPAPPAGFALAAPDDNCVAYYAGPSAYWPSGRWSAADDYVTFWVWAPGAPEGPSRDATASWGAATQNGDASLSPAPPFGPASPSGHSWLCSLTAGTCA